MSDTLIKDNVVFNGNPPKGTEELKAKEILALLRAKYKADSKGKPKNAISLYADEIYKILFEDFRITHIKLLILKYPFINLEWMKAVVKFRFDIDVVCDSNEFRIDLSKYFSKN